MTLGGSSAADRYKRCSLFGEPPEVAANSNLSFWEGFEYWQGVQLSGGVGGGGEVLLRASGNTAAPTDGNSWPLVTQDGWQIRCLSSLASGNVGSSAYAQGEGFIALAPDGTQYRFDWLVARTAKAAYKLRGNKTVYDYLYRVNVAIYPTQVTDRYGNTVTYTWNPAAPAQLLSIQGSDGRTISLSYVAGTDRVASVTDGTRTWTYAYTADSTPNYFDAGFATTPTYLTAVTLPDASSWQFALQPLNRDIIYGVAPACPDPKGTILADDRSGSVTHPSGAVATYTTRGILHGRKVASTCTTIWSGSTATAAGWNWFPRYWASRALVSKSITGPGLLAFTWQWNYPTAVGGDIGCTSCPDTKAVTVTDARGYVTRYVYGIVSQQSEGLLLQRDEGWDGTSAVRSTSFTYRDKAAGPYPAPVGTGIHPRIDSLKSLYHVPLQQRVVTQDGASFSWSAASFDALARPLAVTRSSSLGYSRTDTSAYFDLTAKWVLGQLASLTESSTGLQPESHSYDMLTGNRTASYRFGLLTESFVYNADGTLATRLDAASHATTYASYQRGLPQLVTYGDGSTESAVVNSLGLVTALTNAAGTTTSYSYDAAGRLASITPPADSGLSYYPTTLSFVPVASIEYGLPVGHWRQTVTTGNAVIIRYFDALYRPLITRTYDAADEAGTSRVVQQRWDADGRKVFESYPLRSIAAYNSTVYGQSDVYDWIGRPYRHYQDGENGLLTTSTDYLSGFQRRVTNPRGYATTTTFFAQDAPDAASVASVSAPEGVSTSIQRNVFGQSVSVTRSGPGPVSGPGGTVSATRSYVYDAWRRLCKTLEPERGATVQAYDTAGNVSWSASGQNLPSTLSCDQVNVPAASKSSFAYDALNRLTSTSFGDGSPGITRSYTADGLLAQIASGASTWSYAYNNRRLLTGESLALTVTGATYSVNWGIDAYGRAGSLAYPGGPTVSYARNALGEATQVSGFASGVSYHPNGAVAGYTLANGIVHSTTQTLRGQPLLWRDAGVIQDSYAYDANGSVSSITDQQENLTSRILGYDGLDRLTSASGIWGAGVYGYDGLDNLRSSTVGGRTLTHSYDASNRLVSLSGTQSLSYGYDARGNLTSRGAQAYSFDIANRLLSAPGKATYGYDGHGRRTWVSYADGSWKVQFYSLSGELLFTKHSSQGETRHIGLGRRLLAEQNSASGLRYAHTDALGSPVAWTNASGQLITRTRYEPYGGTAAGTNPTGIGYTGHVNDADTGLVYMQQRYYDPLAGRFLSVDPVVTDPQTGGEFNRYAYVGNDPLDKTDPTGSVVVAPDNRDRRVISELINRLASGVYKFNKNGNLIKISGRNGGSQYYSEQLDAAIANNNRITIDVASKYKDPESGASKSVDESSGGGVTIGSRSGGKQEIIISGRENSNLVDRVGHRLLDLPSHILAHELVGHAIPHIVGSDTGNAISNENIVRRQQYEGAPLRASYRLHFE